MKKLLILISVVLFGNVYAYAQNTYGNLITKADSLYRVKNYKMKSGKARASSLALLEDRVALREGRKQIYGS